MVFVVFPTLETASTSQELAIQMPIVTKRSESAHAIPVFLEMVLLASRSALAARRLQSVTEMQFVFRPEPVFVNTDMTEMVTPAPRKVLFPIVKRRFMMFLPRVETTVTLSPNYASMPSASASMDMTALMEFVLISTSVSSTHAISLLPAPICLEHSHVVVPTVILETVKHVLNMSS